MQSLLRNALLVCAVGLLPAGAVLAADKDDRGACRADVEKLCKGVEPGEGRLAHCMKEHESEISPGCKEHMAKMHEAMQKRMQAFNEACKGDVEKYCKDVKPGEGRMAGCLRKNEASLSAGCKEQMTQMDERREHMHKRMQEVADACKSDMQQYCKDVQMGGGRMGRCLKENEAKLSEGCKTALAPKK